MARLIFVQEITSCVEIINNSSGLSRCVGAGPGAGSVIPTYTYISPGSPGLIGFIIIKLMWALARVQLHTIKDSSGQLRMMKIF